MTELTIEEYYREDVGPRIWIPLQGYRRTAECLNDVSLVTQMYNLHLALYWRVKTPDLQSNSLPKGHTPSVNQWAGYERELVLFYRYHAEEHCKRFPEEVGRRLTKATPMSSIKVRNLPDFDKLSSMFNPCETPGWVGFEEYHISQRKILLYHDPNFYSQLWPHLWNSEMHTKKFWPVFPSRIEAFWPNGQLPTKHTPANLAAGVLAEDVIECLYESVYSPTTEEGM